MSDLQKRNAKAMTQTVQHFELKLAEMNDMVVKCNARISQLSQQLESLTQKVNVGLYSKMGTGPTS